MNNKKTLKKNNKGGKNKKGGSIYSHNYMRNLFKVDTNINDFIVLYAEEKKLLFFILDSFFNKKYNPMKKKLISIIYTNKSDMIAFDNNNPRHILETIQIPYFIMILFMHIHLYAKCQKIVSVLENQNIELGIIEDFNNKMCQIITINKNNIENVIKYIKKIIFVTCLFNQIENVNNSLVYLLIVFDLFSIKEQLLNHKKKNTTMFKFISSEKSFNTIINKINELVNDYKQKIITRETQNQNQEVNATYSNKNNKIKQSEPNENKIWQPYQDMIQFVNSIGDGFIDTIFKMDYNDFVNTNINQFDNKKNTSTSVDIKSFRMVCKQDFISKANQKFGDNLFRNNTINASKNDFNIKKILEENKPEIVLNDIINVIKTLHVGDDHSLLNDLINFGIFDQGIHFKYSKYLPKEKSHNNDFYHQCFASKIASLKTTLTISSLVIYNFDTEKVEFVFNETQLPENLYTFKKKFAKLIDTTSKNSRKINNYVLIDTNKSDVFIPFTGFISNENKKKKIFEGRFKEILEGNTDIPNFEDTYTLYAKAIYIMIYQQQKKMLTKKNKK